MVCCGRLFRSSHVGQVRYDFDGSLCRLMAGLRQPPALRIPILDKIRDTPQLKHRQGIFRTDPCNRGPFHVFTVPLQSEAQHASTGKACRNSGYGYEISGIYRDPAIPTYPDRSLQEITVHRKGGFSRQLRRQRLHAIRITDAEVTEDLGFRQIEIKDLRTSFPFVLDIAPGHPKVHNGMNGIGIFGQESAETHGRLDGSNTGDQGQTPDIFRPQQTLQGRHLNFCCSNGQDHGRKFGFPKRTSGIESIRQPSKRQTTDVKMVFIVSLSIQQNRISMQQDFDLRSYDYHLPGKNIAQHPADRRDTSRLLVLSHPDGQIEHRRFADIVDLIPATDMLVVNDTRVFPARLTGKKETGGKIEVFLIGFPTEDKQCPSPWSTACATALLKASKRPQPDSLITIGARLSCRVLELLTDGKARIELRYTKGADLADVLAEYGQVPLPPYIERTEGTTPEDRERYQTVYADAPGAVAAPTAGLHFTDALLQTLSGKGIAIGRITLHVGYGTFAPVRTERIKEHNIHEEYVIIPPETAETINTTRKKGGRIWAVGTTTVRALEFAADDEGRVNPVEGWCSLYIMPGYRFKVIDNLITNFHLPCSSLLFLVSALCGRKTLLACYREAIENDYRFYSYGDAMAIIKNHPENPAQEDPDRNTTLAV